MYVAKEWIETDGMKKFI